MKSFVYVIPLACSAIYGFNNPVHAQGPLADEKQTVIHFWRYSNCVTQRDRWRVERVLAESDGSVENLEMTAELAKKYNGCLPDGSKMQFSGSLFRAALAGALLNRKYRYDDVADYTSVPNLYSVTAMPENADVAEIENVALKQFSERVSRMAPAKTHELFSAKPFSKKEDEAFASLQPEMGHCLPVSEGKQLSFTRLKLRTLLAEIGYELDIKLVPGMKEIEQTEAQN